VACAAALTATIFASAAFAATRAAAPVNATPPTIDGSLYAGKTLTSGTGAWSNNPTTFTYKWIRCNNPTATRCNAIAGATDTTYTLTQADVGRSIAVFVSASNSAGTAGPPSSKTTDLISAANAPAFKARPTISGTPQVGEALVAKVGSFFAGIPHRITFQWQSCDQNGANCKDIKAGESVVILASEFDSAAMQPVANVTTDASGAWTALVRPHIQTTTTPRPAPRRAPGSPSTSMRVSASASAAGFTRRR
jgi:hypothetical protein